MTGKVVGSHAANENVLVPLKAQRRDHSTSNAAVNVFISMMWLLFLMESCGKSVASEPGHQHPPSLSETLPTPDRANRQKHATMTARGTLCEG